MDFEALEAALAIIVEDLRLTGYDKAIFRSDGEPALLALLRAIATRWGVHVIPQTSAPGDVQSHGAVENAVKLAKGHVRIIKSHLERRLDEPIPPNHPLIGWMARYAGCMHARFAIGRDKRTPYMRQHGRAYGQRVAIFGEKVEWVPLRPDSRPAPLECPSSSPLQALKYEPDDPTPDL